MCNDNEELHPARQSAAVACPAPRLHEPTLAMLYPTRLLRQTMLRRALEYTRNDRAEAAYELSLGHYPNVRAILHRLKGTVCLLTRDLDAYALFESVDQALQLCDKAQVESLMPTINRYLDTLEAAVQACVVA